MCIICDVGALGASDEVRVLVSDVVNAFLTSFEIVSDKTARGELVLTDGEVMRLAWCEELLSRMEESAHREPLPNNVVPFKRP